LRPIQRDGTEYEFDVVGDLDIDNRLVVTKTRCSALAGRTFHRPGEDIAEILRAWLNSGAPADTASGPAVVAPHDRADSEPRADFPALGAELEIKLGSADSLSPVAALSAEYTPKFKGAPADVLGAVRALFERTRTRLKAADTAELEKVA